MAKSTKRTQREARRKKDKLKTRITQGVIGILVISAFGILVWGIARPSLGEEIPLMANSGEHIDPNTQPVYDSDPPTSGPHFGSSLPANFYEESDRATLPQNPEGYLVHNLEHGHVILWYNCDLLDETACAR